MLDNRLSRRNLEDIEEIHEKVINNNDGSINKDRFEEFKEYINQYKKQGFYVNDFERLINNYELTLVT